MKVWAASNLVVACWIQQEPGDRKGRPAKMMPYCCIGGICSGY